MIGIKADRLQSLCDANTVIHCITEGSVPKETTTPRKGPHDHSGEAALGGGQISVGLEPAPKKNLKALLKDTGSSAVLSRTGWVFFLFHSPTPCSTGPGDGVGIFPALY